MDHADTAPDPLGRAGHAPETGGYSLPRQGLDNTSKAPPHCHAMSRETPRPPARPARTDTRPLEPQPRTLAAVRSTTSATTRTPTPLGRRIIAFDLDPTTSHDAVLMQPRTTRHSPSALTRTPSTTRTTDPTKKHATPPTRPTTKLLSNESCICNPCAEAIEKS